MIRFNTELSNALMVTDSLRALLNGGRLRLYSGPVPATAGEAIDGGSALIATVTVGNDGSTNLTFESTASNGVLRKTAAENWQTTSGVSADITFYRYCADPADDGTDASGAGEYRVQGTVGTDISYDLMLPDTNLSGFGTLTIGTFQLRQPNYL